MSIKFEDLKLTVKEMAALIEGARRFVPIPTDDEESAATPRKGNAKLVQAARAVIAEEYGFEEPLVTKRDVKENY